MTNEYIEKICKKYNIQNFVINDDKTIDVNGGVNLWKKSLYSIPLRFKKVDGTFTINDNNITSLNNSPEYVDRGFYCDKNEITSLEGCPNYVRRDFGCRWNKITSLEHLPINFHVGGDFFCNNNNNIKVAKEFGKLFFGYIGGDIYTDYDVMDKFLNVNKNPPKKDLPRLLSELRKITL